MSQRIQFIEALDAEPDEPFRSMCVRFGISPKTGYKWVARFNADGPDGLDDVPSRPRQVARATPPAIVAAILELRKQRPRWGPKKIRARLCETRPTTAWPAVSTVGDILKRHGAIVPRRRRLRWRTPRVERPVPTHPNATWTVDFKGDFALGDGTRCYPLTVMDLHSRYLLTIACFRSTISAPVEAEFARLFELYGVPARIRSDNGVPFCTKAPGSLSRLAIRWVKLGIVLERTDPGHPEQNGAHERMHGTLKEEVTRPPKHSLTAQQVHCDWFRQMYNTERPHEALGQKVPASLYTPSTELPPTILPDPTYAAPWKKLRVDATGRVNLQGQRISIHRMLAGEWIGLERLENERWVVFFGPIRLGLVDLLQAKPRLKPFG